MDIPEKAKQLRSPEPSRRCLPGDSSSEPRSIPSGILKLEEYGSDNWYGGTNYYYTDGRSNPQTRAISREQDALVELEELPIAQSFLGPTFYPAGGYPRLPDSTSSTLNTRGPALVTQGQAEPTVLMAHPLSNEKGQVLDDLLNGFAAFRRAQTQNAGSDSAEKSKPASGGARGKSGSTGKRKAREDIGDDTAGDSNGSSSRLAKKTRVKDGGPGSASTFACPFSKKDETAHRGCFRYELRRIRDVKQHLRRCHRRRAIYCPLCYEEFEDEERRDSHIRERSCAQAECQPPNMEGLTESQIQKLSGRLRGDATEEAQWFAVFEIVFPGYRPLPESPYVDRRLTEEFLVFRDYVTSEGPRVLSEHLRQRQVVSEEQDEAFLRQLIRDGLERIAGAYLSATAPSRRRTAECESSAEMSSTRTRDETEADADLIEAIGFGHPQNIADKFTPDAAADNAAAGPVWHPEASVEAIATTHYLDPARVLPALGTPFTSDTLLPGAHMDNAQQVANWWASDAPSQITNNEATLKQLPGAHMDNAQLSANWWASDTPGQVTCTEATLKQLPEFENAFNVLGVPPLADKLDVSPRTFLRRLGGNHVAAGSSSPLFW